MGKPKHTPGPWSVSEDRDPGSPGYSVDDEDGFQVAQTYELGNAQLIAAAPAMLEALEHALEAIQTCKYDREAIEDTNVTEDAMVSIRAALAAARGEEVQRD